MKKAIEKAKQQLDSEYCNQKEKLLPLSKKLTKKEKAEFNKLYRNGNLGKLIELFDPKTFQKTYEKCL